MIEDGQATFHPLRLARFDEAEGFVRTLASPGGLLLVAIDQPTIVPDLTGSRPVERVAASLVSRLGGGVQPGRRGGGGAAMFGDAAPIWRFLSGLELIQDPDLSRVATQGRFAIEVFPALALPSLFPEIWVRKTAAKYNPAQARNFLQTDWHLVCRGLAERATAAGLAELTEWATEQDRNLLPRKADQDKLDAALCLLIAHHWRHGPREQSLLLGDRQHGYIVTPATADTAPVLRAAAARVNVAVDQGWTDPIPTPAPVRWRGRS